MLAILLLLLGAYVATAVIDVLTRRPSPPDVVTGCALVTFAVAVIAIVFGVDALRFGPPGCAP